MTAPRVPSVVIIGAGFGGMAAAVALRRAGFGDITIVERADGVGGTWRSNTYPGAACDVQSHLYSLSFAPNPDWSRTYARQPEILAYLETVADDFGLRRHLRLETTVTRARWHESSAQWRLELETASGPDTVVADVLISAVGLFAEPRVPDIDGLSGFPGPLVHTSRWDHTVSWAGRRVGVIGTGASGVQVIPELAQVADHVTVFQRTPPWMVPKDDRYFTAEELERFRRDPAAVAAERERIWTEFHVNSAVAADDPLVAGRQGYAEAFLDAQVAEPGLREALTPDYPFRCKRVLLGAGYYQALQRDHVELVTDPIVRVGDHAIDTASGRRVDVDAIVLATGFETSRYLADLEVFGTGGRSLHDEWGDDPRAYLGVAVHGYPNFFMLYGPNTNQGGNSIVYVLEAAAELVVDAVRRLARRGGSVEVRADAQARFNARLEADLERSVWTQCDSYFRSPSGRIVTQWPYTELEYARATERLRDEHWHHRHD
ncbi:putative flavoprotein involved in K+ transport [Mycolicibacterium chubuense NBB4]|uniref:Putative flavoprotein involved in K+ transport n=1 Tax=Mycolicibacterium chubuense (strain NBB4) TaxID=710421 RepID=I4BJ02_MYCCN|nr:NAD(P)/FAD-dependent oxidoreductase [Mycolicibacterium chubuense]AFM17259.1 putative flavoprotein involved in K+ transport [Mycolicibacterium chubuense NBB4]